MDPRGRYVQRLILSCEKCERWPPNSMCIVLDYGANLSESPRAFYAKPGLNGRHKDGDGTIL